MAIKQLKFVKSNSKSASGIYEYICRLDNHQSNSDKCLLTGHANLPSFAENNPQHFWKMADKYERANAKCSTHIVVTLPRELDLHQQAALMADFVGMNFKGCPLSWAIHEGYGQHNPHAHLQICERRITSEKENGLSQTRFFKRNGVKKDRRVNHKSFCSHLYRQYAGSVNHHLEKAGSEERLSVEAEGNKFLEMSFSEKVQQHMDRQMAELEKKHKRELAEKLKIKREREEKGNEMVESVNNGERPAEGAGSEGISKGAFSEGYERRDEVLGNGGEGIRRNADEVAQRKQSSARAESKNHSAIEGTAPLSDKFFTGRGRSTYEENTQSDGRLKKGIDKRSGSRGIRELAEKVFESVKMLWHALFKKKAIEKIDAVQSRKVLVNEKVIPSFNDLEITQAQECLKNPISLSDVINENNEQKQSRGMKF